MTSRIDRLLALVALLAPGAALAGGGPANVLVLYNRADPEAAGVAEHYRAARSLDADHLCALDAGDPSTDAIPFEHFQQALRPGFEACLARVAEPEQIDYLVLVRGLPYRVDIPDGYSASLGAVLQIHRAHDGAGELAGRSQYLDAQSNLWLPILDNPVYLSGGTDAEFTLTNPARSFYAAADRLVHLAQWPHSFRRGDAHVAGDSDYTGNLFVVTRLDGFDYQDARALVDRAVASDGTFPAAPITCLQAADGARGARDPECEYVVRKLTEAGLRARWLSPFSADLGPSEMASLFTGAADAKALFESARFVPGAIACNLTSLGAVPQNFHCSAEGLCPQNEAQTSIARLVRAGVTGVHGAVAEPINHTFPNAGALLLYTAGYNLGESFFFNQAFLYWQNVVLGDPLATPYAARPTVRFVLREKWPANRPLAVRAGHANGIAEVVFHVDGRRVAASPRAGDDGVWEAMVPGEAGSAHDVLVVAVARNATMERPGWAEGRILAQPDVQGWARAKVTLAAPEADPAPASTEPASCSCSAGARAGEPMALLALAVVLLRRWARAPAAALKS